MSRIKCRYGETEFLYQVIYLPKKQRKIAIHIHPNGAVQVDAPEGTNQNEIRQAVAKRARWVLKHLSEIQERQHGVFPRKYVSGESHFYLGRRYMLKKFHSSKESPNVKLHRGQLQVTTNDKSPEAVKQLLWAWYTEHAQVTFERRLAFLAKQVPWARKLTPGIKLQVMKRQWGNCSPRGKISLNPHLVKAPRDCIDYVILHELCHMKEHNHSKSFYRILTQQLPEWPSIKARLDNMSEIFLNE